MLAWFDENPAQYWWLFCSVFIVAVCLIIRPLWGVMGKIDATRSDWRWALMIFALLLAGRWPGLFVTREFNQDESQFISGAFTLRHDPIFWRSVDGHAVGPLDFYALWPVGLVHGTDDYFSARVTSLLLITGTLFFAHQTIAREFGRTAARAGTLGAICFEAITLNRDFLHYSAELLPIFLLSLSLYLGVQDTRSSRESRWTLMVLIGVLLGLVPFTKSQGGPIAAAGGVFLIIYQFSNAGRSRGNGLKQAGWLTLGALLPVTIIASMLTFTRSWQDALIPYLFNNVNYLQGGFKAMGEFLARMAIALGEPGDLFIFFALGISCLALLAGWAVFQKKLLNRGFVFVVILFLFVSTVCALAPRRPFPHYLQFTLAPLSLLSGACIGVLIHMRSNFSKWTTFAGMFVSFALIGTRAGLDHPEVGRLSLYQSNPAGAVGKFIRANSRKDDALCAWGWESRYYVEAGLRQATRESYSRDQILAGPYSDYYRARYLADFNANQPAVFIDTSDTPAYPFPPKDIAHENSFPALGAIIRSRYTLVSTIYRIRIYLRNDRLHP